MLALPVDYQDWSIWTARKLAAVGSTGRAHLRSSCLYHIHCVVPAGGLSADHQRWIPTSHPLFLLPTPTLRTVFREKFLLGLRQLYRKDLLDCRGPAADFSDPAWFQELMKKLGEKRWFVYDKPTFGPSHVLRYLGRYTHRMAISNHRLTAFDGQRVSFRWRDYAHGSRQRIMTLTPRSSCPASSCTCCPKASCASATTACSPTAFANSCCPWRTPCSRPRAASNFLCPRCPTAISGTVPAAEKPCASSSALPLLSYIWQPSILLDRRHQSAQQACSTHLSTPVCPEHEARLENHIHRHPGTARSLIPHATAHHFPSPSATIIDHPIICRAME
jgi:hypothetical protein